MAFNINKFSPVGGQGARGVAPQIFSYLSSTDTKATMQADGYFNEARTMLELNDIIITIGSDGFTQVRITAVPLNGDIATTVTTGEFASAVIDNISLDGNTISITNTDGNLTLVPNGTGHLDIYSPPSTEESGININGTTYDSALRINDIGGTAPAQAIIHKHSTTLPPALIGARTNNNTDSHTTLTSGQSTLAIYGAGWTGSHYDLTGQIDFSMDTSGTISSTSSPGRIRLMTTPDGSNVPVDALTIDSSQKATFSGVSIDGQTISSTQTNADLYLSANGLGSTYMNNIEIDDDHWNALAAVDQPEGLTTTSNVTFASTINSNLTADELIAADSSKKIVSLPVSTYPSKTEIAYVKGVTSAIQTQLDAKSALATVNTFTKAQTVTPATLTSSANSVAIDASLSNIFVHDLTENTTLASPSNLVDGTTYNFIIKQHASSSYTVAYNSTFKFPDGIAPVMPTTASGVMMISCIYTTVGGLCCVSSKDFS
jgi:hypothetical protein